MKTTGITRKIDELGRVVIPKEIRRNLGIRDGENLEIFINDNAIILKKHYQMESFTELGNKLCNIFSDILDINIMITDREKIIATDEKNKFHVNKLISEKMINLIDFRETYISESIEKKDFFDMAVEGYFHIVPIISSIDCLGLVIIFSNEKKDYLNYAKLISKIMTDKIDVG